MRFRPWLAASGLAAPALGAPSCRRMKLGNHSGPDVDLVVLNGVHSHTLFQHCSYLWPNEAPHLAVYPSPPGCLTGSRESGMILPGEPFALDWVGGLGRGLLTDGLGVNCLRVMSKTVYGAVTVIVGEMCEVEHHHCDIDPNPVTPSATCAIQKRPILFEQETGFHRSLGGDNSHAHLTALQWLPREFFAEVDELERKTPHNAQSIAREVNIEHPSDISPAQLVRVTKYPFPVHARVNAPSHQSSFFRVYVPDAIWQAGAKTKKCEIETSQVTNLVKELPKFGFTANKVLVRIKAVAHHWAEADIPVGNPDDLQVAALTAAVSATSGLLAIVLASMKSSNV